MNIIRLKERDVTPLCSASVDPNGFLFRWEGGLYRAVSHSHEFVCRDLLKSRVIGKLFDLGLIETEIASIELEGYPLVLKHRELPFVSYVTEWCGSMLKDAAMLTLDISEAVSEIGLELQDAHPWNVLFDGCSPRFIDFGSIVPKKASGRWRPSKEFTGTFFNPLRLMTAGFAGQARSLLVDPVTMKGRRLGQKDVLMAVIKSGRRRQIVTSAASILFRNPWIVDDSIGGFKKRIDKISVPLEKTRWSDYSKDEVDLTTKETWIVKRKTVHDVIENIRPKTLLDIGGNTGWFSKLAAMYGSRVITTDYDDTCINKLYSNEEARKQKILPLVLDFTNPTPAYGINLRCRPATERLRCDMVLGLAIVHHLVFRQKQKFEQIVSRLSDFTGKWLLVEFIPKEDKYVSEWYNDAFSWYTPENFSEELKKHFRKVDKLPSNPEPRMMFLCER
ncbi:MAG TPA: class I SAM-dependent methyltransferase [Acidobacteriota bacterium]|jgi:hypothetical protein|nr:class I SAM-dependent methyltransferase [Acidobacteriota bacterium]